MGFMQEQGTIFVFAGAFIWTLEVAHYLQLRRMECQAQKDIAKAWGACKAGAAHALSRGARDT